MRNYQKIVRRECRFCGSSETYIRMVGGSQENPGRNYAYVQCGNGKCGAQGPVRESPLAAARAWNWPLPVVWSPAAHTTSED